MPDVACAYTLSTPAGTVVFNAGGQDQFYISEIPTGLAGAPVSAPIDAVAFDVGSKSYNWWQRGPHIQVEGMFLITSTLNMNSILAARNQMEDELRLALASIAAGVSATGTLSWTPYGGLPRSLTVRNDVPLECVHDQNYLVRTFTFGLFSDTADSSGGISALVFPGTEDGDGNNQISADITVGPSGIVDFTITEDISPTPVAFLIGGDTQGYSGTGDYEFTGLTPAATVHIATFNAGYDPTLTGAGYYSTT